MSNYNSISHLIKDMTAINAVYPPLTKQQERDMIEANIDDRDRINELLVLHNMRLVFKMTEKYKRTCFDYDEMIQAGLHGLTIAASRFKLDSGNKFSTYAAIWIRKHTLTQFYTKFNTHINANAISFDREYIGDHNTYSDYVTNEIDDPDYLPETPSGSVSDNDSNSMYHKLLAHVENTEKLDSIDKVIFTDYFINQHTLKTIAKKVDRSIPLIQHRKTKVIKHLKQVMRTEYNISEYIDI